MNELGDLMAETLRGTPGLPPGLDEVPLDQKVAALDRRMTTVGRLVWFGVAVMGVLAIVCLVLLAAADDSTTDTARTLFGAGFVMGLVSGALLKLWQFQTAAHTAVMKEVLRTQALVAATTQGR